MGSAAQGGVRAEHASRRSHGLTLVMIAAGVLVASAGIYARAADLHFQTVLSNSMQPTMSAGDVAVTQAIPVGSLQVGDAIAFVPPGRSDPVLHRITSLHGGVITTRGDANPVDDPWNVTLKGATGYRLVAVIPLLGWLTDLRQPALLLAGLLVGLAILNELRKELKKARLERRAGSRT